jgi:hypothetical protein
LRCDAAYWNEARLRCEVCALPLGVGRASTRRPGSRHGGADATSAYRCDGCRATPPPFDATLALADYRAPLDGLARGLKFRARLALGAEFAARLASRIDDTDVAPRERLRRDRAGAARARTAGRAATTRRGRSRAAGAPARCARRRGAARTRTETAPQSRLDAARGATT